MTGPLLPGVHRGRLAVRIVVQWRLGDTGSPS